MKYKFSLFILLLCGTSSFAQTSNAKYPSGGQYSHAKLTYKIIPSDSSTYGYDIYADGNLILHQPSRPAMNGKKGFSTKLMAEKVAGLVIEKIKHNQMPPPVSKEELKKLNVY